MYPLSTFMSCSQSSSPASAMCVCLQNCVRTDTPCPGGKDTAPLRQIGSGGRAGVRGRETRGGRPLKRRYKAEGIAFIFHFIAEHIIPKDREHGT